MSKEFTLRILSSIIILPISLVIIKIGSFYFAYFLIILFFFTISEWNKLSKNRNYKKPGIFFVISAFISAFFLREVSLFFLILTILICVASDIGGYSFGKILKGPKITKISPNKTYAGMFGSFLMSYLISFLFINEFSNLKLDLSLSLTVIFLSFVCQMGDLIISYFKRIKKVKDTSNLIPGHGGLLDRIDGILFAIPVSFLIYKYLIL